MRFQYAEQPRPEGLAQAYIIGAEFVGSQPSALVLGDNLFYGHDLQLLVANAAKQDKGATVFAYHVSDPERYGVVEFDRDEPRAVDRGEAGEAALKLGRHRTLFL